MPNVQSSAIETVNFDADSRTLFVRFVSGETYAYFDVPASVYDGFLRAPSKGRWFSRHVRDRYRHHHIR